MIKLIRLFFIKNKLKNKKLVNNNDQKILEKYKEIAQKDKEEILQELNLNIINKFDGYLNNNVQANSERIVYIVKKK